MMSLTQAREALDRLLHEAAKVPALQARIAYLTVMAGEPIHYPRMVSGPPCPWCGSTWLESDVALRYGYEKGERNAEKSATMLGRSSARPRWGQNCIPFGGARGALGL